MPATWRSATVPFAEASAGRSRSASRNISVAHLGGVLAEEGKVGAADEMHEMRLKWDAPRPRHLPGDEPEFGRQAAESHPGVGFAVLGPWSNDPAENVRSSH
jgi:hypothetical protein